MPNLTKDHKQEVLSNALRDAFSKHEETYATARTIFADELYQSRFGNVESQVLGLDPCWLYLSDELYVSGSNFIEGRGFSPSFKLSRLRPLPLIKADFKIDDLTVPQRERFTALHKMFTTLDTAKRELTDKLAALLTSVRTFDQFRKAWPECEKYLPTEPGKVYPILVLNQADEINDIIARAKGQ